VCARHRASSPRVRPDPSGPRWRRASPARCWPLARGSSSAAPPAVRPDAAPAGPSPHPIRAACPSGSLKRASSLSSPRAVLAASFDLRDGSQVRRCCDTPPPPSRRMRRERREGAPDPRQRSCRFDVAPDLGAALRRPGRRMSGSACSALPSPSPVAPTGSRSWSTAAASSWIAPNTTDWSLPPGRASGSVLRPPRWPRPSTRPGHSPSRRPADAVPASRLARREARRGHFEACLEDPELSRPPPARRAGLTRLSLAADSARPDGPQSPSNRQPGALSRDYPGRVRGHARRLTAGRLQLDLGRPREAAVRL